MRRSELGRILSKLELLEGRTFTVAQADAWFEILSEHSQADALAAVLSFHSKPFKRPSYPGDIKAHVLETEGVRLRRCGTLDVNEADHLDSTIRIAYPRLRALVGTGQWTPSDYREYRRSGLSIEEFHAAKEALPVG